MKKLFNYLIATAIMAFTFTSCEDVPSPFGEIIKPDSKEDVVIEPSGSGTEADPYNVAGVLEFISGLGADVQSTKDVYVKGVITEVKEVFTTQYGNAQFIMSDTEKAPNKFTFYRGLYLGNTKYSKESDTNVKDGDVVVICGKVVNYKGNTPETVQGAAYVVSINGQGGSGGGGGGGSYEGAGTLENPYTAKDAIKLAGTMSADDSGTAAYVKGKVASVTIDTGYGNATYYLSADGSETDQFQIFRGLYFNGDKFTSTDQLKKGDDVVVYGNIINFKGNTPEMAQGSQIYSINNQTSGGGGGGGGEAKGSGTLADPYNATAANNYISSLPADQETTEDIYIKGKLVKYANNGEFNTQYGNASFYLSDDGKETGDQFYVFRTLYLGNVKYASGATPQVGDEIIICGKVVNYKGNTPETAANKSYIYSINGDTGSGGGGGGGQGDYTGAGTKDNPYTAADACKLASTLADKEETSSDLYVKGKISSVKYTYSTQYGTATFNISNDGSTNGDQFTVYGVYYFDNKPYANDSDPNIQVGDEVIVCGKLTNYNGTYETANKKAYLYSLNGETSVSGGGGSQGGGGSAEVTSLQNGDFETWEGGLPKFWKSACTASSATLSQSTDAHGGSFSVCVAGDASSNKRLAYQEITLAAGTYNFSFYAKATTGDKAQVRPGFTPVSNGSAGSYSYGNYADINNNGWTLVSYDFTLDSEKTVCLVVMNPKQSDYSSGKDVLIDDATLTKK